MNTGLGSFNEIDDKSFKKIIYALVNNDVARIKQLACIPSFHFSFG